jgi:hypothetical protein
MEGEMDDLGRLHRFWYKHSYEECFHIGVADDMGTSSLCGLQLNAVAEGRDIYSDMLFDDPCKPAKLCGGCRDVLKRALKEDTT